MMPCNLVLTGKNFDIDSFLAKSKLRGFVKKYKGEPMFKSKPDGRKLERSRTGIETSKADFDDLNKQIKDTIGYLKRHKDKLSHIKKTKGIEVAVLDFGIALRIDGEKNLLQSDRFPTELLKLAGEVGLDIELSIYPVDLQDILERRKLKAKTKGKK